MRTGNLSDDLIYTFQEHRLTWEQQYLKYLLFEEYLRAVSSAEKNLTNYAQQT